MNCPHSFRTKTNLKSHEKVSEKKYFCGVAMPSQNSKILGFNQYQTSDERPCIIYANLQSWIYLQWHNVYRAEDFMEKFCESLREHIIKIINFEKKKMIPLTNDQQELYQKTKRCYICKTNEHKYNNDENYCKVKDHCHYTGK